jgi:AraC-like DNA-binding protein
VATSTLVLQVALSGLRVVRWSTDELYTAMKETYTIASVVRGHSRWWTNGRVYHSRPGSIHLQQPGDVHRDLERSGPTLVQIVSLPARVVEPITGRIRVEPQLEAEDPRGAALQRLHGAVSNGADRLTLEVAVTEAIEALPGVGNAASPRTRPVRRALELMHDRLGDELSLDELAEHSDFDKFHLCRAFRAQVGMPPHAYLTHLRIKRAKELLASGSKPSEVATRVGLYDQSQLNRHFRRIVGVTPGAFARALSA